MVKNFEDFINESQKFTDEILDKISANGINSLTTDEKAYLDALSKNNKALAQEIEDRVNGVDKKPEFKFDSDDEDDEEYDEDGVMSPDKTHKKLIILTDQVSELISKEIAPDLKGDEESIDSFLRNLLICISKIQKNDYIKALDYISATIDNFDTESDFFKKYSDSEWFREIILYLDDMEQMLLNLA